MFFAELGANVIKVENPKTEGDITRKWKSKNEKTNSDISAYFSSANWGKKSVGIDLAKKEGQDIVKKLADQSDIVISSYKPGDSKKLNVDYPTLSKDNSELIYAQITGYGDDDPRTGYDAIIQAEAGFMHINGFPDKPPVKMPVAMVDILTGHHVKEAILIALLERRRNNSGKYISISLFDVAVSSLANQATNYLMTGHSPERIGSEHPNIFPYGTIFRSKDHIDFVIAITSDAQFEKLAEIIQFQDIGLFHSNDKRIRNKKKLQQLLATAFLKFSFKTLSQQFLKYHLPIGRVNDIPSVFKTDQAKRLILKDNNILGLKTFLQKNNPNPSKPPKYSEHSSETLTKELKLSKDEILRAIKAKVIFD